MSFSRLLRRRRQTIASINLADALELIIRSKGLDPEVERRALANVAADLGGGGRWARQ